MNPVRILIVDDEENIRETMRFALEALGYRVETAADGPSGLAAFGGGESWDLVLLDQRMPGMEGLEALRQIRERDPEARVLMVTAYGTIELAVDAMKTGAVDFLRKPFTPNVLRGAVKAALAHPRQRLDVIQHSLSRLLPPLSPDPLLTPIIHFRTLNGFRFWPLPLPEDAEETAALRIRRVFEIQPSVGECVRCAVDLTTAVRGLVAEVAERDLAPADPIWDVVCRTSLSAYLWERAELPPESFPVYSLSREQLEVVRSMIGVDAGSRRR